MESWRRNLYVLWVIEFLAFTGLSLILPFIPLYVRELGITELADVTRWSGLLLAGPFMVSFITTPVWGALGDRYGQKLMVVRALFGSAVAYLAMGLVTSVTALFAWRLALGAVSGFLAAGMALVAVTTPDDRRGYALGALQSVVPASGLIGPMLGGALADAIGYRPIFLLVAAICALCGVVAAITLAEPRASHPTVERTRVRDNIGAAWAQPLVRLALLTILASQTVLNTVQPIFVLFVESLGVEARYLSTTSGVLFAATGVSALIAAPWWGRRGDRAGFTGALTVALLGAAVVLLLHGVVTSPAQLFAVRFAYGFFLAGVLPNLLGIVTQASALERRGGMMALCSSAIMLGNLIGPLGGGYLASHLGLRAVFLVSALTAAGLNLAFWCVVTRDARRETREK